MRKLLLLLCLCLSVIGISAQTTDAEGYPHIYLRGSMTDNFSALDSHKFTRTGDVYTLTLEKLDGTFKIADSAWGSVNHTYTTSDISGDGTYTFTRGDNNAKAVSLKNVTISFTFNKNNASGSLNVTFKQQPDEGGDQEDGNEGGDQDNPTAAYHVYFENTGNWPQPYVWAWTDQANCTTKGSWPGDAMTKRGDLWYWELPAGKPVPTKIIFNNNSGTETANLPYVNGATYKADAPTPEVTP